MSAGGRAFLAKKIGSCSIFDQQFNALINAAEGQRGPNPSDGLRDALNAFAQLPSENRPGNLARLAVALPELKSPAGAGFLAVWLGAGVERGDDPDGSVGPVLEAFLKWCGTLETDADGDDPAPDEETATGLRFFGHALVAHLARAPGPKASAMQSEEVLTELERIQHLSIGVAWVLQLLRQRSGDLAVFDIENRAGVLVRYENLSNCFHLFTLLQGALAGSIPGERTASEHLLAIAKGEAQGDAGDEAWWHYGQGNIPEANVLGSVWGEKSPDHIARIDGEQVLLLWPTVFARRSWDSAFFLPFLDAARPSVEVTKELSKLEVEQWWARLSLPEPKKAWWKIWPRAR